MITSDGKSSIITISSNNVSITNLSIRDEKKQSDATVSIVGDNNYLGDISIETQGIGIKLLEAHDNTLENITITGDKNLSLGQRGNGIDLWGSHGNNIQSTTISHVKDGIYIESSKDNVVASNEITHSRYGYHLMFTEQTNLQGNISTDNASGMMIMGTKKTTADGNILKNNQKSARAQGILLFDVTEALIINNEMTENKIGIYMEQSSENEIKKNEMIRNYIGIQVKEASNNQIYHNSIMANVVQGQADQSANNDTHSNYWGNHVGLDTNGDGKSNTRYIVDPYFLSLTEDFPVFQLFFQTPGMEFLKLLLQTPSENWFIDESPLMDNPVVSDHVQTEKSNFVWMVSLSLVIISTGIFYTGVRKR
ncbi:right-handed parallel beta-helix repeat-containing protein [Oceanobacillus halophilus]|uniref:right-handed parallel beta-helix repeat-containing protein n=1 Tax=Oceanobacillus halophilus TaxID=930130 RepID=UPI001314AF6C|nr:NosD domain-containing protein [Oceanobacillus halophilus]